MAKKKISRFEVTFKERLEQQRKAHNAVRLPLLGYAPYRVYEIEKIKGVSKITLNGTYGSVGTGKSSYNISVLKSRQTSKTQLQQVIWDYMHLVDALNPRQYEVKWLKEKQATLLRLKGHRVEPTTTDDKSNKGPVSLGA